jgi:hypothetical protein
MGRRRLPPSAGIFCCGHEHRVPVSHDALQIDHEAHIVTGRWMSGDADEPAI